LKPIDAALSEQLGIDLPAGGPAGLDSISLKIAKEAGLKFN
jgi:ribonuclease HIII